MSNRWQTKYTELTDFIAEHSEIKIEPNLVIIPENIRPEFYQLFDVVRMAFVEEKTPNLLNKAMTLSRGYIKAEQKVTELLGLEEILLPKPLHWFLHNPNDGLTREIFHLLFDLLKKKVDIETFEAESAKNIEASFRILYIAGYEKWIALSLIKLIEADKLFQVSIRRLDRSERTIVEAAASEEEVPPPQESKHLSFDHTREELFAISDFIVHSTKRDVYISLRSHINRALATASNASYSREWYSLDSTADLGLGKTLIYIADKPTEISLVADAKKICRPDMIIECKVQQGWYEKEGLDKVKLHYNNLKPILGTYIVSNEPLPEQALNELGEGIQLYTVGLDASKLVPIIDILTRRNLSDD